MGEVRREEEEQTKMRVESEGSLVDLEAEDGCYKAGGDGRVKSKQQAENRVALTGCREPSWELPDYCDPDVINRFGPNGRKFHLPLNFSACFRPCRPARKLPRPHSAEVRMNHLNQRRRPS